MIRGKKNPLHFGLPGRLAAAREAPELARTELAMRAGLSHNTVQRIEADGQVPGVDTLELLADVLKVSPCWLAYGEAHDYKPATVPLHSGLPERLRRARTQAGLSMRALAKAAQTSDPNVLRIEGARVAPGIDTVEKLAKALKVSPCWLAYGVGPGPND